MIKKINLAICAVAFAGAMQAQNVQNLSLKEAIDYALLNKAAAQKASLDLKKGDAQIMQAKAGALPKVDIVNNTTYNPIIQQMMFAMQGQAPMIVEMGQKWQSTHCSSTSHINRSHLHIT